MQITKLSVFLIAIFFLNSCNSPARDTAIRGLGVEPSLNYAVVKLFYATDRKILNPGTIGEYFGPDRGDIQYGVTKVSIPRNHKMGILEAPSVWKLEFRSNPEKHVMLIDLQSMDSKSYFKSVHEKIAKSNRKNAFIFVHGYNVSFADAARRTAQISYDLGFDGAPIFYSWPSSGELGKYTVDENNAEWTINNLEIFLSDFAEQSQAEQIYLIGHSMGARALTRAYASVVKSKPTLKNKFTELILAAPDIDADVFKRDIAPMILSGNAKITLYASSEDIPLIASKKVHGYPRAGESGGNITLIDGIETIDSTGMGTDFLNHSYFSQNRSIISDIFYIFNPGLRAMQRSGLESIKSSPITYWGFKK